MYKKLRFLCLFIPGFFKSWIMVKLKRKKPLYFKYSVVAQKIGFHDRKEFDAVNIFSQPPADEGDAFDDYVECALDYIRSELKRDAGSQYLIDVLPVGKMNAASFFLYVVKNFGTCSTGPIKPQRDEICLN